MSPSVLVALDVCGESSEAGCLAVDEITHAGVAGTIRLDRREDLRAALSGVPGIDVAGDATLVLAAYRRWGERAFGRLAGDFALLVWDDVARTCHLVRDPFGIRRLHHASWRGAIVFSTDVEGVLAWPGVSREPDDVTILDNLLARYQTRERTFFSAISRVPPGHHLRVSPETHRLVGHIEFPRSPAVFRSLGEYAEAFRFELARSVEERLPPGAVASHLSGGLDSMSIAALARAALARGGRPHDLTLMTARFDGWSCDEGPFAHELARHLDLPVREWDARVPEVSDLEDGRVAWPFGRSSMSGACQGDLALAERYGASVILSGAGGNQMAMESGYFRDVWRLGGPAAFGAALAGLIGARPWRWQRRHLRRTLVEVSRSLRAAVRNERLSLNPSPIEMDRPAWLGPRLQSAWHALPSASGPIPATPVTGSWLGDAVWDLLTNDPTHVWTLEHEDARATERGLEFRYPYLSWSLMALTLSIPPLLRPPAAADRSLQRTALCGVLPDRLRTRDTVVRFNESIMLNTQRAAPQLEALLTAGPWASAGLVERQVVVGAFRALSTSMPRSFDNEIGEAWRLVRDVAALEAWLRRV